MAEVETPTEEPKPELAPPRSPSLFMKIAIVAAIGTVVVAECIVAMIFIPGESQTKAMAEEQIANSVSTNPDPEAEDAAEESNKPKIEIPIGDYSVTAFQPVSNTTLRIDFKLFGEVQESDQAEFNRLYQGSMHRFREQVIVTVRNSDVADLTDPGLGLIKRKILEKVNRQLGKELLKGVVFSEFSFVEQ
jgi:flagellar basal body-associated protein FliL